MGKLRKRWPVAAEIGVAWFGNHAESPIHLRCGPSALAHIQSDYWSGLPSTYSSNNRQIFRRDRLKILKQEPINNTSKSNI